MEPNGIFLNRTFQMKVQQQREGGEEKQQSTFASTLEERKFLFLQEEKDCAAAMSIKTGSSSSHLARREVRRSYLLSTPPSSETGMEKMMMGLQQQGTTIGTRQENYYEQIDNVPQEPPQIMSKNKLAEEGLYCMIREDNRIRNEWNNNNNSINSNFYCSSSAATSSSTTTTTTSRMSSAIVNAKSGQLRGPKKIKSKSGVQGEGYYSNFSKISKSSYVEDQHYQQQPATAAEEETMDDEEESSAASKDDFATTLPTNPTTSHSLLTWKLPSFLCLPFTNNDNDNSYLHLVSSTSSSKSSGILSLTSLLLVVMAVFLASVPAPVMSASSTGQSSLATDDINNNDVTGNDYPTTSSSITPVKLQTIQFTSASEGTTPEDAALFLSSSATGRTTGGSSGPSVTHQSVEGLRQEPSMNDFTGWKDADSLTGHAPASEVESSSDKVELLQPHEDDESELLHKEYEFKSGYPELHNETREALQEEGSNHQPVVFVGGSGYVPPNSVRTRPVLEEDPLYRPLAESRYPVPLQSAWDRNYRNPFNMTRVQHIEAECQDDFMRIKVAFNGSFQGLIYSSGYSYDPDCVYINGTGRDYYEYLIKLNRCGTLGASNHVEGRREPSKNFMWNTVTVQYNPMIEEEWDEHFKVTCEYGYDFWKTVTFPFLDVEVATGNPVVFTLTPPECYMEVRYGFGTTGTRVGGPVRVGDPLTLMINMRSQYDGFDIVVNDCYAHNGATKRIQLIDHYGCPVDSKLMSPFRGSWSHTNLYETQVYAYLKTFRFTGSPALYIECDVRMCHGQCPAQPCYWRNVKSISKRSTDTQQHLMITDTEKNSTLSENLSLFQALRVLQEDEDSEALKTNLDTQESVCMKTGAFTAMIALSTFILVILTVSTMIMCFRLRRVKVIDERETAADILRPYSHHVNQSSQHQQQQQQQQPQQRSHHRHHHHWSSSSSAKPR